LHLFLWNGGPGSAQPQNVPTFQVTPHQRLLKLRFDLADFNGVDQGENVSGSNAVADLFVDAPNDASEFRGKPGDAGRIVDNLAVCDDGFGDGGTGDRGDGNAEAFNDCGGSELDPTPVEFAAALVFDARRKGKRSSGSVAVVAGNDGNFRQLGQVRMTSRALSDPMFGAPAILVRPGQGPFPTLYTLRFCHRVFRAPVVRLGTFADQG
jgi:hypothetical protein